MCQCSFRDSVLHGGATLTVTANISQRHITEKLLYVNPGGDDVTETLAHPTSPKRDAPGLSFLEIGVEHKD